MNAFRVLLFWLALLIAGMAAAQTFPALTGRVVDDAHLLNAQQAQELTDLSKAVEQASSRQFVVATVPSLQGQTVEDYGYKLGRFWKIGQEGANNGIILLVAPTERQVRIEVGYGLEPIMPDALVGEIIDHTIIPKFKSGDMGGGVVAGAHEIAEQLKLPLEAGEQRAKQKIGDAQRNRHNQIDWGGLIFAGVIVLFLVVPLFRRRGGGGGGWGGMPIVLWGGGGGGWGSGSGWSSGDSGWSSGGGDSFSGGGGSFGGGGASGSW